MPFLQYDRDTDEFSQLDAIDGEVVERLVVGEIKVFRENGGNFERLSFNMSTCAEIWTPVEE